MNDLYIFGCSGFAVECAQLAIRTGQYKIAAFIDKDDSEINNEIHISSELCIPVLSESLFNNKVKSYAKKAFCIIAIANSLISLRIYNSFKDYCVFPNIIDPSTHLNDLKTLGIGNIIFQNVFLSWNVGIGNFNKILFDTHIGHESIIGDFNEFNPKVSISGNCTIGNMNLFGVGSMIFQGKKIGNNNTIGMGSVVIRNIKSNGTWFGNPAKLIQINDE